MVFLQQVINGLANGMGYVLIAIGLVFVFMLVNGISLGISDSNPISSAFVLTVLVLAAFPSTCPITSDLCIRP